MLDLDLAIEPVNIFRPTWIELGPVDSLKTLQVFHVLGLGLQAFAEGDVAIGRHHKIGRFAHLGLHVSADRFIDVRGGEINVFRVFDDVHGALDQYIAGVRLGQRHRHAAALQVIHVVVVMNRDVDLTLLEQTRQCAWIGRDRADIGQQLLHKGERRLALGLALLMTFNLANQPLSLATLVIGHIAITTPYIVRTTIVSFTQLDSALLESATSLGASPWHAFRTVTLPLIAPGIAAGAFIAFTASFDNVAISLFLSDARSEVLPIRMWHIIESNLDVSAAAVSGVLIVVTVVLMLLMERLAGISKHLR